LHRAAVAVAEAAAVHGLHAAEIRRAVVGDRNVVVGRQLARHAGRPQQLAIEPPLDERMQVAEKLQRLPLGSLRRRDELRERFGIIGGYVRMGQRCAECRGVRPPRQCAVRAYPQALFFHAAQSVTDQLRTAGAQPLEACRERPAGVRKRG
jgi:hypothetical protein